MRRLILFSLALGLTMPTYASFEANKGVVALGNHASWTNASSVLQNTVTGTVSGPDGPLAGVTVSVVGSSVKASTDESGKFSISAAVGSTLRFSYVGYESKEVTVAGNTMNVTLQSSSDLLDEVVVVGYGTQKKGNLTGAVSTISVKDNLEGRPIADVGRGIQGVTPGLTVTVPSGEVGSDPRIKIRGAVASLQASGDPLILLDNVEIPSIQYVNPDDIESITVLKDAASSSIYGAKAAFGVILITTKTGAKGEKIDISYSNNFSFQNPFKQYEMGRINALKYTKDAMERIGSNISGAFYYVTPEGYEMAKEWDDKYGTTLGPNDPTVFGRDWIVDPTNSSRKIGLRTYDPYDYMVREWAPTITNNASINGSVGRTKYTATFGHISQSGMLKAGDSDKFKRANAAVRVSTDVSDYLTLRAGAMFSQRQKLYPYATNSTTADPWYYMYRWSSVYPMGLDENGSKIRSPWSEYEDANEASMKRNYINLNAGATVNMTKNWRLDVDYNFTNEDYDWFRPGTRFTAANSWIAPVQRLDANGNQVYVDNTGAVVPAGSPGAIAAYDLNTHEYTAPGANPDHVYARAAYEYKHTFNAFSTYNLNLDNGHEFKFMVGSNLVSDYGKYNWTQKTNLLDLSNPQFDLASGTVTGSGGTFWTSQVGFFGRVNYAFKNKYLLEANARYDGSSKFVDDLIWRWFTSASAGWVASEENFMQWAKPALSHLKFRGSYGIIGNQAVPASLYTPNMFPYETLWIGGQNKYYGVPTPTFSLRDISWEDLETIDFGVDARFLNNRLGLVFDYYVRNTNNMFVGLQGTTWTTGGAAPLGNFGTLKTKGYEVAVDYNHRFNNGLGINVRANFDDAISRFYNVTSQRTTGSYYDGSAYGDIWGYETDRLYQMDDFVLGADGKPQLINLTEDMTKYFANGDGKAYQLKDPNGVYQPRLENTNTFNFGPGDVKFKDLNGDGEIDNGDGTVDNPGDRRIIGNTTPRYNYGLRLGADYKGFDFSIFFQGTGQRAMWGNGALAIAGFNTADGAMPAAIVDDYWTPDNTGAFYPAAFNNAGSNDANNMQIQSKYLLDLSYTRIKNITFGYVLPKSFIAPAKLSNVRVYVALENFFTWDKLNGLPIDPEVVSGFSMFNESNYNTGRTGVGTPTFKSASFGVQLNF
ncbi:MULTISPECIES: SusC/RagA family TonB-linked outer membrane protein [Sphingobacterium]|uniref:SusC/RagA family TonB-linked outer membrane protein n=1 Tax=Sphingobacterium TaxID=28453 RepID=UPI001627883B|nr:MULTISPECIES: SusC/RagA family TonB-linked outer membrane protein [Sphingobacterium]MBV2228704.1 SusC/RagA family TonB-linked outer membrane protein [Sphingobacterium mizutaii]